LPDDASWYLDTVNQGGYRWAIREADAPLRKEKDDEDE
jgi:hypothetical protein